MSLALDHLNAGLTLLLGTNGESVTLVRPSGNVTLKALVNRNLDWRFNHTPGFPSGDGSIIEFKTTALASAPVIGEQLTDAFGGRHRIARFKRITDWYRCECVTSK